MGSVTVVFEFTVGDMVYFKDAQNNHSSRPVRNQIIERRFQELSSGIGKSYILSNGTSAAEMSLTLEIPAYSELSSEEAAARARDDVRLRGA